MEKVELKNKLKLLIAYNVGEVFGLLFNVLHADSALGNQLVMLISRYNDINRDARFDRLSREETSIEMNKLRFSILSTIDEMDWKEIDYQKLSVLLIDENKFNQIIEKRVENYHFRGFFDDTTIPVEYLYFNWEYLFLTENKEEIKNFDGLIDAVRLVQLKLNLPLLPYDVQNEQNYPVRLPEAIKEIRTHPSLHQVNWSNPVETVGDRQFSHQQTIAAFHETLMYVL